MPIAAPASPRPNAIDRRRMLWAVAGAGVAAAAGYGGYRALQSTKVMPPSDEVCVVAPPTPYDPASGQPMTAAREVPSNARCPVCGMYPARSRDWAAQVIFKSGDAQFFDSPLSLFMYLRRVPHYSAGRKAEDIVATYVSDAASRRWIDAHTAFFVQGSNALGPMRAGNFPAFAQREEAQAFSQKRDGEVVTLDTVSASVLEQLSGARRHQHEN